jgi:hypothetical protein
LRYCPLSPVTRKSARDIKSSSTAGCKCREWFPTPTHSISPPTQTRSIPRSVCSGIPRHLISGLRPVFHGRDGRAAPTKCLRSAAKSLT